MSTRKRKENRSSSSSSNNNTRIEDDDEGTVITHGADDNDADSSEEGLLADELITNQDEADNFDVDFEFFDADENDYHAVKMYLNAFLDPDEQVDTAELANLICSDASVSNVIKVGTEVMGFAAVLPFAPLRNIDLGQQLQRIVLARAPAAMQAALTAAFANDRLGLLVSERTLNCPPQLVPHLHSLLHEEVHNTGDETDTFRLDQLLMIAASFRKPPTASAQKKARAADSELQFHHYETPAYVEQSTAHFSFPVKPLGQELRWTWRGNILPHSTVLLLPVPAVPPVLARMAEILQENSAVQE